MLFKKRISTVVLLLSLMGAPATSYAASCTSQSQMSPAQRDALSNAARDVVNLVGIGDVQALRARTLPAIASDFGGIAATVERVKPQLRNASITIETLDLLDASGNSRGGERTQFFCGSPLTILTFGTLPPGVYALTVLHATGVPSPQQISVILAKSGESSWLLAGFYSKPMIEDGHDGIWYWVSARKYAQMKMKWNAWLYYRVAANLVDPADFISSPNLEKLLRETDEARPSELPVTSTLQLDSAGAPFEVTTINTTTQFGALDLEVGYAPDPSQAQQLRTPASARKQITAVMGALLALHPELAQAFHGAWVHANRGDSVLFALELPMSEIRSGIASQP
jgi:hypothetical protein